MAELAEAIGPAEAGSTPVRTDEQRVEDGHSADPELPRGAEDEVPPPPPPPAESRPAAKRRAKGAKETIFSIPGLGDLRFNAKALTITAHCQKHAAEFCRKEKIIKAGEGSRVGQGRPIGLLVQWLRDAEQHDGAYSHIKHHTSHVS